MVTLLGLHWVLHSVKVKVLRTDCNLVPQMDRRMAQTSAHVMECNWGHLTVDKMEQSMAAPTVTLLVDQMVAQLGMTTAGWKAVPLV
jgi:hypothetical protein